MNIPDNATDQEIDEFNRRQEYIRDALPDRWIDYSLELQQAAESLWGVRGGHMEVTVIRTSAYHGYNGFKGLTNPRAYVLLAGLALENALKAQLVLEQPSLITAAKIHKPLKSHSLTGLMAQIRNITFSVPESKLAAICESAIPYWGRYPVPLNFTDLANEPEVPDEFHTAFVTLNKRVRKAVYEQIKDGWDSGVGPKVIKIRSKEFDIDLQTDTPFQWVSEETP